ncbi:glutaredoxin family protein [Megalodesulfovibrio paquesii]
MHPPVTIYALSTCVHCTKARELLDTLLGGDYACHYIDRLSGEDRNDRMRELRLINPTLSFPTIRIGDAVILGHKEEEIRKALGL